MQKSTVCFENNCGVGKWKRKRENFPTHLFFLFFIFFSPHTFAQTSWNAAVQYHYGSIVPHNKNISHLITDKPDGFLFSINKISEKKYPWQHRYHDPDVGISFHSQYNHNEELGNLFGAYAHYNFYFLQRHLQLRIAQGVAYATNPFDKETNYRNVAYGSKWMPSTYFMLSFDKKNIFKNIGVNAGLLFIHHSNATIKSPNTSTNTLSMIAGFTYDFRTPQWSLDQRHSDLSVPEDLHWRWNTVFRTGVNESHIVGMGQKPFYHVSVFAEKPMSKVGGIQLGAEIFLSHTLKELIPFLAQSFPETGIDANTDWKRMGLFVGYEWYLNRLSIEGQLGYYIWDEYKENGSLYQRLGVRYYIHPKIFGSMSLKTHFAKAEAFELGLGYKW